MLNLELCFVQQLEFSNLNFQFSIAFRPEAKKPPPIIGRTCAFDAKIYKIVGDVFAVSVCVVWNKKFLIFPIFIPSYHRFWSKFI